MPDGYGVVFDQIVTKLDSIEKGQGEMKSDMQYIRELTTKHEKILYGDPEQMGKGGLIDGVKEADRKAEGIGKRLDGFRNTFIYIWSGVITIVNMAINVGLAILKK